MKKKILKIIAFPIIIAIIIILYMLKIPIECPINKFFDVYCPGCGVTRMLVSIIHLDFYSAFRYNMLVFILLPFLTPYLVYTYICYAFDKKDKITSKIPGWVWYVLLILTILFGILRNIPYFSFLAPID